MEQDSKWNIVFRLKNGQKKLDQHLESETNYAVDN